jgi:hypothetical protein
LEHLTGQILWGWFGKLWVSAPSNLVMLFTWLSARREVTRTGEPLSQIRIHFGKHFGKFISVGADLFSMWQIYS